MREQGLPSLASPSRTRSRAGLACLTLTFALAPVPGNGSPERIGVTAVLREGLEFMDDEIRAAFVLRDLLELPVDEVAAVLETSP
jgi:DNA-directed RNA polymerase specialized sigma24 family protein